MGRPFDRAYEGLTKGWRIEGGLSLCSANITILQSPRSLLILTIELEIDVRLSIYEAVRCKYVSLSGPTLRGRTRSIRHWYGRASLLSNATRAAPTTPACSCNTMLLHDQGSQDRPMLESTVKALHVSKRLPWILFHYCIKEVQLKAEGLCTLTHSFSQHVATVHSTDSYFQFTPP